jgi:hypothetical protein
MKTPTDEKDVKKRKEKNRRLAAERQMKVLEFTPKEEEEPDDFGDVLHDIINAAEEDEEGRFHAISYSQKGVVISWDENNDMLLAHVHNMTNMELNYLLQRMIINIHVELS